MKHFDKHLALAAKQHNLFPFYRELTYFLLEKKDDEEWQVNDLINMTQTGLLHGNKVEDKFFIKFLQDVKQEIDEEYKKQHGNA